MKLDLDPLTALIGANGAGKSSTVRALQFMFGQVELDNEDVTDGLEDAEVAVAATFTDLPPDWRQRLRPWLNVTGDLVVTRSRTVGEAGRPVVCWASDRAQAPGCARVRAAAAAGEGAAALKAAYVEARALSGDALPAYQNKAQALQALDAYEAERPEVATDLTPDHALSFGGGGAYDLNGLLELLVLPAMRDAADDAGESRGSTLGRLVELTVRSELKLDGQLAELSERTERDFLTLLAKGGDSRLQALSETITGQIAAFAPGTSVKLSWEPKFPSLSPPPVRARIVESGHEADIGRQGHGVQRAYVFSLLRALLDARRGDATARPGLLLVVEEPEVYQHPVRARYVARVLAQLAADTAQSTQVVYTTHSPYFVSVDNVPAVRLLRLTPHEQGVELAPATRAAAASLDALAGRLEEARDGAGQRWSPERVAAQLPGLLGSAVSEGLFADAVVLVEGEEDVGLIDGSAAAAGVDLAGLGIALVSVGGKDSLLLASEVFRALGVPVYVVFDSDEKPNGQPSDGGALRLNAMLAWLAGGRRDERPPTRVTPTWAVAKPTLRAALDVEAGAFTVLQAYSATARSMGLPESTCKNGHLVRTAVGSLYADGFRSATLDGIVAAVTLLTRTSMIRPPTAELSEAADSF